MIKQLLTDIIKTENNILKQYFDYSVSNKVESVIKWGVSYLIITDILLNIKGFIQYDIYGSKINISSIYIENRPYDAYTLNILLFEINKIIIQKQLDIITARVNKNNKKSISFIKKLKFNQMDSGHNNEGEKYYCDAKTYNRVIESMNVKKVKTKRKIITFTIKNND